MEEEPNKEDRASLIFNGDHAVDDIAEPFRETIAQTRKSMNAKASMIMGPGSIMIHLNEHGEGLSANSAALAIVSTLVGGGIVGLPYAMLLLGLVVGILTNLIFCYITAMSGIIFLKLRENIPGKPNSLFEIGYMLQGRKSIFLVAATQVVFSFGLMMIYFIVFGDTAAQVVGGFTNTLLGEAWYA